MFTKNFSPDSWVYNFLAWPGNYLHTRPETICQLRTWVLAKLLGITVACAVLMGYVSSITYFLLYKFTCGSEFTISCVYGFNNIARVGGALLGATLIVAGVLAFIAGCIKGMDYYNEWAYDSGWKYKKIQFLSDDNSIKLMYRSWKDKVCYPVTFGYQTGATTASKKESWDDVVPSNETSPTSTPV